MSAVVSALLTGAISVGLGVRDWKQATEIAIMVGLLTGFGLPFLETCFWRVRRKAILLQEEIERFHGEALAAKAGPSASASDDRHPKITATLEQVTTGSITLEDVEGNRERAYVTPLVSILNTGAPSVIEKYSGFIPLTQGGQFCDAEGNPEARWGTNPDGAGCQTTLSIGLFGSAGAPQS